MDRARNLNLRDWGIWELLELIGLAVAELQSRYTSQTVHHHPPPPVQQQRARVPRGSCGEECRWCGAPCARPVTRDIAVFTADTFDELFR